MNSQNMITNSDVENKDKKYFLILPAILTAVIFFRSLDNDIWFLLAHGRYVINHGIPTIEPFTIHEGFKFVMQQWLSAVIFFSTYSKFGELGIKMLIAITYVLSMIVFYKLCLKLANSNFFKAAIITYIYIALICLFMTSRPFIFTNLIIISEIYVLESYFIDQKKKQLAILPILSLILINIQASIWPMLFVVMLPFAIDSFKFQLGPIKGYGVEKKPLIISAISMLIVGFINPYGIDSMLYIKNSYGVSEINNMVQEMGPTTVNSPLGLLIILFSVSITFYYIFNKSKKWALRYALLAIGTSYLSFLTIRAFFFFICCAIYPLSLFIGEISIPKYDKQHPRRTMIIRKILISLIILITSLALVRYNFYSRNNVPEIDLLDEALQVVIADNDNGEVALYTGYNDGGFAEYNGIATYIDPRAEVFLKSNNLKEDVFFEYYELQNGRIFYKEFLDKYNFTHVIVSNNDILYTYLPYNNEFSLILSNSKYKLFKKVE